MSDKEYKDIDFVEVERDSIDDGVFYNAVQVAEMVDENISTIRSWTKQDVFGDLLDIKRVNGRRVFTKVDVENLKFVKSLRSKNYTINQTREIIAKKGFHYAEYDSGLIDTKDPLGFQALAISIAEENNKKFDEFSQKQEAMLKDFGVALLKEVKSMVSESENNVSSILDEVCVSLDDKLPSILKNTEENIKNIVTNEVEEMVSQIPKSLDINSMAIKNSVDEIISNRFEDFKKDYESRRQEEVELRQKEMEQRDKLLAAMEERKRENESKGFFKRLLGR